MRRGVECPKCGAFVKPPGDKPYCPSCDWNRETAEKYLRREIRAGSAILVLIGMGALVAYIFNRPGSYFVALLSAGIFIFGGGIIVWKQRALNQLRTTVPHSDRLLPRAPFSRPTPFPEKYEFLRSLPRPRKVRSHWLSFLGGTKKRLLVEGEIAFGRIMDQKHRFEAQLYSSSSYSEITYEFRDSSGFLVTGNAIDETNSFFEEMIIPVFYDPQNPRKNTVLSNLEEIVKPGDE